MNERDTGTSENIRVEKMKQIADDYPGSIKIYFNPDTFTFSDYYLMRDSLAGFDWSDEVEFGDNYFLFSELQPHQVNWINSWLKTEHAKKVCGVKKSEMKE